MRSDLKKVIFERAKAARTWASKTPRKKVIQLDSDGFQSNESANHIRLRKQKYRNSHYRPVDHFLETSVGRAWKDVYSELCQVTDTRDLLGLNIRNYVQDSVALECWQENRVWMTYCPGGPARVVKGLFVHPRTGVVMRVLG